MYYSSRERNREHARRTRLRKKAILESLKKKLSDLQDEVKEFYFNYFISNYKNQIIKARKLTLKVEESNTANILLCLSSKVTPEDMVTGAIVENKDYLNGNLVDQIRSIVRSEAIHERYGSSKCSSDTTDKEKTGESDFGSDSEPDDEINPKTSKDESIIDLDNLKYVFYFIVSIYVITICLHYMISDRKERNRMNAKLTRDRKKMFIFKLKEMINTLERQNTFMRNRILKMEQMTCLD